MSTNNIVQGARENAPPQPASRLGITPTTKAKELIIGNTMALIEGLQDDLDTTVPDNARKAKFDQHVIKQMKKLVNRMARDIGADDQYIDVV